MQNWWALELKEPVKYCRRGHILKETNSKLWSLLSWPEEGVQRRRAAKKKIERAVQRFVVD